MPKFRVPATYTFSGEFVIEAKNAAEAAEYAEKHCGLVLGGNIHSSLPDEDVDWNFPSHPVKGVTRSRVRRA